MHGMSLNREDIQLDNITNYRYVERASNAYRGVLIQGVVIEEFYCIQRYPHFKGLE